MDGIIYMGQPLSVRRPKEWDDSPFSKVEPKKYYIPGIVSSQVDDAPDKIFLGNLPKNLTDLEVQQFVSTFGALHSFNLVKDQATNTCKGYAFFRYKDPDIAAAAIEGLNGIVLGGNAITCQFAGGSGNVKKPPTIAEAQNLLSTISLPALATLTPAMAATQTPSHVLVLYNMVTKEELQDEQEYKDIVLDVQEECGRYGTVVSLAVPRGGIPAGTTPKTNPARGKNVGKVYVEFSSVAEAQKAAKAINGRQFSSRTIMTSFLPEVQYQTGMF
eukprot:g46976.t1